MGDTTSEKSELRKIHDTKNVTWIQSNRCWCMRPHRSTGAQRSPHQLLSASWPCQQKWSHCGVRTGLVAVPDNFPEPCFQLLAVPSNSVPELAVLVWTDGGAFLTVESTHGSEAKQTGHTIGLRVGEPAAVLGTVTARPMVGWREVSPPAAARKSVSRYAALAWGGAGKLGEGVASPQSQA